VELRLLCGRRADLVADRTRTINRLRQQLTGLCPALERAACLAGQRGWLVLLARWQRPAVELPRVRGHLNAYERRARDGSSCATHSSAVPAGVPG
jgi:hypothetical protein